MNPPKLSIIIPGYNEERSLKNNVLDKVYDYLKDQKYDWEVLVVDDGSNDNSIKLIEEQIAGKKGFRVIKNPHFGKAVTVMTGLLEAKGEIALFTDMDQATPLREIELFFPKFEKGFDIVIGSRDGRKGYSIIRKLAAITFSIIRNVVLGLPFSDTQCGFKAFNKKSRDAIFPKLVERYKKNAQSGYIVNAGFDSEVLYMAKKAGFKITDIPVEWQHVESKSYQLIKNAWTAFMDIITTKLRDLRGEYN